MSSSKLNANDRILISPLVKIIPITKDEVLITHGLYSRITYQLVDENRRGILADLLLYLQGKVTTVGEVLSRFSSTAQNEEILELLARLYELGVLVKETEDLFINYVRLLKQTERVERPHADILLVGSYISGLGMVVLEELVKCGFTRVFVLYDNNAITRSNIRYVAECLRIQQCTHLDDNPLNAISILKDYFRERYGVQVEFVSCSLHDEFSVKQTISNISQGNVFAIVAADFLNPSMFKLANNVLLKSNIPFIVSFIDGSVGFVGPIVIPYETPCYLCFERALDASIVRIQTYFTYKEFMESLGYEEYPASLPIFTRIVGSITALYVVKFLLVG
jgi:hypothetical protein